eukprot:TRINITY_DN7094_c0_g1_i1.p1 TRINITY_DN7094_c0_g1~~TRINITY_DN7094_c0_g1_i1.p1  ORF type:complete len:380 (-),score=114.75 TRINITY_DN7094_c0_g1_i1:3-1031(-)
METTFSLKLVHQNDIRRIQADANLDFNGLQKLTIELFGLKDSFNFRFRDDEGDVLTITNDREFREALRVQKDQTVKFFVNRIAPGPSRPHCGPRPQCRPQCAPRSCGPRPFCQPQPQNRTHDFFSQLLSQVEEIIPVIIEKAQEAPKESKKEENKDERPVHFATCDGCHQTIVGLRFKCFGCPDYDLCEKCYDVEKKQPGSIHNKDHLEAFVVIEKPTQPFFPIFDIFANIVKNNEESEVKQPTEEKAKETETQVEKPVQVEAPVQVESPAPVTQPEEPQVEVPKAPEVVPGVKEEKKEEVHPFEKKLNDLKEMGFEQHKALQALVQNKGEMLPAVQWLLKN